MTLGSVMNELRVAVPGKQHIGGCPRFDLKFFEVGALRLPHQV
jgi:hypothetical protein